MYFSHDLNRYIENHNMPQKDFLKELERETNLTCIHPRMLSGHIQGNILYMLCKMIKPKRVLELGTYTGYSSINMALALDNDAVLHTIEICDEQEEIITKYIEKANLQNRIILHIGDAIEIVPKIDEQFDLVFIDANKRKYPEYYNLVFNKIKQGGYILADNILWDGKVVDTNEQNDPQTKGVLLFNKIVQDDMRVENIIFPIRDGMMIIRKK